MYPLYICRQQARMNIILAWSSKIYWFKINSLNFSRSFTGEFVLIPRDPNDETRSRTCDILKMWRRKDTLNW